MHEFSPARPKQSNHTQKHNTTQHTQNRPVKTRQKGETTRMCSAKFRLWEDTWLLAFHLFSNNVRIIADQRQNVLMTVRASSVHGMSKKKTLRGGHLNGRLPGTFKGASGGCLKGTFPRRGRTRPPLPAFFFPALPSEHET